MESKKNVYSARILAATSFPANGTVSLLMVQQTINGKACDDILLSKSVKATTEVALPNGEKIFARDLQQGSELVYKATGRSEHPILGQNGPKLGQNGDPMFAVIGMDLSSLSITIRGGVVRQEVEASAETKSRREGACSRAISAMANLFKEALK